MALALSRRRGEAIKIGENIIITVGETRGSHTVILIDAPREISVVRIEGDTDGDPNNTGAAPRKRRRH